MSVYAQACGPSGVEHAVSLRFTPSCLASTARFKVIRNLVTAKGNSLHVYDACLDTAAPLTNGHVDGDVHTTSPPAKLVHVRDHLLHGIVTGLERIRTIDSEKDGLHRLLVSFRDAKMAILEWSLELHDVVPVSLHSYERLPQIAPTLGEGAPGHPLLRADPTSRCAAILLPASINTGALSTLALLPLFRDQLEHEDLALDEEDVEMGDLPYAPSYTLDLAATIDSRVHRITDFCFLPGFTEPTVAILFQAADKETWTGRLENSRDSYGLIIFTLVAQTPTVILDCPHPLPHSCQRIFACPPQLGGVIIVTADACIHLDQSGKFTGCAANGWHKRSSALPLPHGPTPGVALDGLQLVFLSPAVALAILREGDVHSLTMERDGRSLAALRLSMDPIGRTVPASSIEIVGREYLFVASAVGDSVLLRWSLQGAVAAKKEEFEEEVKLDIDALDAALYGDSSEETTAADVHLEVSDTLPAYGSIRQICLGPVDAEVRMSVTIRNLASDATLQYAPEVLACAGGRTTSTLTALHRGIPPRKRRRLDTVDDARGSEIWTTSTPKGSHALFVSRQDSTELYYLDEQLGLPVPTLNRTERYATIGVAPFLNGTRLCWITEKHVRLLHPDLAVADAPFAIRASPPLQSVSFADPYILLKRSDGTLSLLQGDETVITKKPTDIGKKSYVGADLFTDVHDALVVCKAASSAAKQAKKVETGTKMDVDGEEEALYRTETPKPATPARSFASMQQELDMTERDPAYDARGVFVATLTSEGVFELLSLPGRKAVFSAAGILDLPDSLTNGQKAPKPSPDASTYDDDVQVESFVFCHLGQTRPVPHLIILLDNGLIICYEGVPDLQAPPSSKPSIRLRFVKVLAHRLEPQAENQAPRRLQACHLRGLWGVFLIAEEPQWLLRSDAGAPCLVSSQMRRVSTFAPNPLSSTDYIVGTEDGLFCTELPDLHYDRPVPWQPVIEGRPFSHLVYDGPSQTYVGAGMYETPFRLFDDEGEPVWDADAPDLLVPRTLRSTLELIIPGTFEVVDGHEFRPFETVLSMSSVSVNTSSTLTGKRHYVCCGTAIYKGEDISTRGAIYMFEIVPVLTDDSEPTAWNRKLRLRFMEDLKSAISNVGSLDGYVYHSMGQKIFAKGWEQDERLLSVAFLDVAFHTTTIVPMKNFLLVGDYVRGVTFVGFQEDPYKLFALGKEVRCGTVVSSDFVVHEGRIVFVVTDPKGVIRLIEYNPSHAESRSGERLLLRTEFQGATPIASSAAFGRRSDLSHTAQQSGILLAGTDGSLSTIMPMRDPVYRRLALLERQLQRHLPNRPAGLNTRTFRSVRNDFVSRALTKGLLDGTLLARLASLPLVKQQELVDKVNTDLDTVSLNLQNVRSPWG